MCYNSCDLIIYFMYPTHVTYFLVPSVIVLLEWMEKQEEVYYHAKANDFWKSYYKILYDSKYYCKLNFDTILNDNKICSFSFKSLFFYYTKPISVILYSLLKSTEWVFSNLRYSRFHLTWIIIIQLDNIINV